MEVAVVGTLALIALLVAAFAKKENQSPVPVPPVSSFPPSGAEPAAAAPVPLSRQAILDLIYRAAVRYRVDPDLMAAIIEKESSFRADAINPSDPSYGLGQVQTFWVWYFGYVATNDDARAKAWLMNPAQNVEIVAQILRYFAGRTNPRTGGNFRFPEEADLYNVGETLWRKGVRNLGYRDDVTRIFNRLKGQR